MSCGRKSWRIRIPLSTIVLLCAGGFFAIPAHAALIVTEIMYDPLGTNTGHQWIEVQNTGTDAIDLGAKDIRLFDSSGNHLIKAYGTSLTSNAATTVLDAGAIAVIAQNPMQFQNDFAGFSGTLLKSSFSLPVSGGEVGVMQTNGTVLAKASYASTMGAKGDGNSLQESGSAFVAAAPTPGEVPAVLPAPLAAPEKLSATKNSTNKRASRTSHTSTASSTNASLSNNSSRYGKGTLDPTATADAAAVGSLTVFSSTWFACFLGLLAFSTFSLILIQRRTYV